MTAYYVLAIVLVAGAIVLSFFGLARPDFPRNVGIGRAIIMFSALMVAVTIVVLVTSSHREHPREEAKAEAKTEAAKEPAPRKTQQPAAAKPAGGKTAGGKAAGGKAAGPVKVQEKEYSVTLGGGSTLTAGKVSFEVANVGKIQHDLAVEGGGKAAKTPLIDPGKTQVLKIDLSRGKYKLYCTVPGHEQLGMKTEVTVK
jgi:uncharacterized cupredoxin-like copper-binding protein